MTPDQITQLVGKRYELGADGPDAFDCRGLLLHCQRTYFGHALPNLPFGQDMRKLFAEKLDSGIWEQVDRPVHGDGVILRGGDHPHVGIWLTCDGAGVLHALEGVGVIWTREHKLRLMGFSRRRYIRFHD
jgi:cell wall-associated NlpC family hydrolase